MSETFSATRTGGFPIGVRRFGGWQKDLTNLLSWAKESRFGVIDIGRDGDMVASEIRAAGMRVGSADLKEWAGMISPDPAKRSAAIETNTAYVERCAAAGVRNFFVVMIPEDRALPRSENFGYMIESYSALAPVLERHDAHIVIEGWPGPGALCCTPETLRALFEHIPSPSMGINYDPSHLVRMGIDSLRFLREFAPRVHHVHGKDTALLADSLYLLGSEQPPTFVSLPGWGGNHWRYTIPGHGVVPWTEVFGILDQLGYRGCVSVELEDLNFNGREDTEKSGLVASRSYLESC